jgi:hydroxymethylglutaryl-CoA reductase (NADPH)
MAAPNHLAKSIIDRLLCDGTVGDARQKLRPRPPDEVPLPPRIPAGNDRSPEAVARRRAVLAELGIATTALAGDGTADPAALAGHIENHVGFASVPVGVIGPLRVNGVSAHGDFYVPLATTEGALVASYHRGAYLVSQSGGATAVCLTECVSRSPCLSFDSLADAGSFLAWALPRFESLHEIVATTSRHCRLVDLRISLLGRDVYLIFDYTTGDAAGQNMVTLATEAVCERLLAETPVRPRRWYLEGNLSGDKKATMLAFASARGKKVVAEAVVSGDLVRRVVHTDPGEMVRYWELSVLGGLQSGSIGVQGHFANALAGLFIACGQDVACVAEASVGLTRMDVTEAGDLYVSVSLPNLIVGTIGGGTALPTARACLNMLGCCGEGTARKFAEICAATVLAGEISIIGSLTAGDFGQAHAVYARGRKPA